MSHQFVSEADEYVSCIRCGALYPDGAAYGRCSGRTDLTHGSDTSAHSLDGCQRYDDTGDCEHLAVSFCDCVFCRS